MLKAVIIDDENVAIKIIEGYLDQISNIEHIASFSNSVEGLSFVQENDVDLIFLDLNMPSLSGLSFLEIYKGKALFILTTAYAEYALEGFKYDVVDYLTKPIAFDRFLEACQKAKNRTGKNGLEGVIDYFVVKTDHKGKYVKINYDDISYIESMRNYVAIHTSKNERIVTLLSMKQLEERLPKDKFFRAHRSYILALKQVKYVDGGQVVLEGMEQVPLGGIYKDEFFELLENKLI